MEALSISNLVSGISEAQPHLQPPFSASVKTLCKFNNDRLKIRECSPSWTSRTCGSRVMAVARGVSDEGKEEGEDSRFAIINGVGLVSEGDKAASFLQGNSEHDLVKERQTENLLVATSGSSSRGGLFTTPISSGVQSATSAHGLHKPALAVRNLMEQARFGDLCTVMSRKHHRRDGYPFGSLVDFAPDSLGHPIFSFSPLAIHSRNLLADPRSTLIVQVPGWSSLSNARVTIFGDIVPLPADQQEWAHKLYITKHPRLPSQQWENIYYFRMQTISDIYFIGGFGTVAWVDVNEYKTLQPDKIAVDGDEQNLKELNTLFSKPLKELLSIENEVDDAAFISIDSKGTDIRVRQGAQFNIQRLSFEEGNPVQTLEEAKAALYKLINRGHIFSLLK